MKKPKMKTYKEKLIEVRAVQFDFDESHLTVDSRFAVNDDLSIPVSKDGKGIHASVAGQRVNKGNFIVIEPDGDVKVLTEAAFNERYE